jgi:hypothetical protein
VQCPVEEIAAARDGKVAAFPVGRVGDVVVAVGMADYARVANKTSRGDLLCVSMREQGRYM